MPVLTYIPTKLSEEMNRFKTSLGNIKLDYRNSAGSAPTLFTTPLTERSVNNNLDVFQNIVPAMPHVTGDNTDYRRFNFDIAVTTDDFQRNVIALCSKEKLIHIEYVKTIYEVASYQGVAERTLIHHYKVHADTFYEANLMKSLRPFLLDGTEALEGLVDKQVVLRLVRDTALDAYDISATVGYDEVEGELQMFTIEQPVSTAYGDNGAIVPTAQVNSKFLSLNYLEEYDNEEDTSFRANLLMASSFSRTANVFSTATNNILDNNTPNFYLYGKTKGVSQSTIGYSFTASPTYGSLLSVVTQSDNKSYAGRKSNKIGTLRFTLGTEYTGYLASPFVLLKFEMPVVPDTFKIKINNESIITIGSYEEDTFNFFCTKLHTILFPKGIVVVPCKNNMIAFDRISTTSDIEIEIISDNTKVTTVPKFSTFEYYSNNKNIAYNATLHPANMSFSYLDNEDTAPVNIRYKMKILRDNGRNPNYISYRVRFKLDIDALYMTSQRFYLLLNGAEYGREYVLDEGRTKLEILTRIRDDLAMQLPVNFIITVNEVNSCVDVVNNSPTETVFIDIKASGWLSIDQNYGGLYYETPDNSLLIPLKPSSSPVVNYPPVVTNMNVGGNEDTQIIGTVTATDPDGDLLVFRLGTGPTNGTATVTSDGNFTYTPKLDYTGGDSFTVIVDDGKATSLSTVYLTIYPVADAKDDGSAALPISVFSETPYTINVLANDTYNGVGKTITHINGMSIASGASITLAGGRGIVKLETNKNLTITMNSQTGPYNFTYTSKTTTGSPETVTVYINVARGDTPSAQNITAAGDEDTIFPVVLKGIDNESISKFQIKTNPSKGTLYLNSNGTGPIALNTDILTTSQNSATIYYKGSLNWFGETSFTFSCADNNGLFSLVDGTASLTVYPVQDNITIPNYTITTPEDTEYTGTVQAVTPDLDVAKYYFVSVPPLHGFASVDNTGTYNYTPDENYNGTDLFTITAFTNRSSETAASEISVNITPVNDAPTVVDYFRITVPDYQISGKIVGVDVDNDTLTYSAGTTNTTNGTKTIASNGNWTYKPSPTFITGTDTFTVTVTDPSSAFATSLVTVTVSNERDTVGFNMNSLVIQDDTFLSLATFDQTTNTFTPIASTKIEQVKGLWLFTILRMNQKFREYGIECVPIFNDNNFNTQTIGFNKISNTNQDIVVYTNNLDEEFLVPSKDFKIIQGNAGNYTKILKTNVTIDVFSRVTPPFNIASILEEKTTIYKSETTCTFANKNNIVITALKGYNLLESITFNPISDTGSKVVKDFCRLLDVTDYNPEPVLIAEGEWDSGWVPRNSQPDWLPGDIKIIYKQSTRQITIKLKKTVGSTNTLVTGLGFASTNDLSFGNYSGYYDYVAGINNVDLGTPSFEARVGLKVLVMAYNSTIDGA